MFLCCVNVWFCLCLVWFGLFRVLLIGFVNIMFCFDYVCIRFVNVLSRSSLFHVRFCLVVLLFVFLFVIILLVY